MTTAGFPHSDTLGSQPGCRLPEDYRRLQRPSSAPGTKTSTVCPYKLDTRHYMLFLQKTEDARVHYAVLKIRTEPCLRAPHPGGPSAGRTSQRPGKSGCLLRTQQCARPRRVRMPSFRDPPKGRSVLAGPPWRGNRIASAPLESMDAQVNVCHLRAPVLLRKEVIQPHLPVRLPCYDFVPIADPTFDSSLPYGLGRRLRVLPTFVT